MDLSGNYSTIKNVALFSGIDKGELSEMLQCLGAVLKRCQKGDIIMTAGQKASFIGAVLSGRVTVYKYDITGNRSIISVVEPPGLFAESFLCAGMTESPVTAESGENTDIILLPFARIINTCSSCCVYHNRLIENMLGIVAKKNLYLNEKLDHISKKTTRHKLASYLLRQAELGGSGRFTLNLDRQGLADYLCVNRSALSRELSNLQKEGVLQFNRNNFNADIMLLEKILTD